MRGWFYKSPGIPREVLTLSHSLPAPLSCQKRPIIVDVHAVALNPDSSVLMRILPSKPRTPEIDFSGVITENSLIINGPYRVGDEVYGHIPPVNHVTSNIGALADKVAVSPAWILPKPADFKHEQAASLPTSFVSAYRLAKQVDTGGKVFVNGGSGGVGLILLQLLKKWKKAHVTTTASSQSWEVVKQQQPDAIVNYREVQDLSQYLQEAHQPFDFIIDLIGDKILLQRCRNFLVPNGTFVAFGGGLSSATMWGFFGWLVSTLLYGLLPRWAGGSGRSFRFVAIHREHDSVEGLEALGKFCQRGWVKPCIDSTFDFEDAVSAYDRLASRRADGKVIVRVKTTSRTSPPSPT